MKKLMLLLLAVMLLVSATAVFAQSKADGVDLLELDASLDKDITILIWSKDSVGEKDTSRGKWYSQMAQELSDMFEHVNYEYIYQGGYSETNAKVMAAAVANELPHIWLTEESTVKGFAPIAADLNVWMPSDVVDDYMDGLLSDSLHDGDRLIGAPAARSLPVLVVNNEVLAAAGWSGDMIKTNDDMFQCAKDIYEKTGKPGFGAFWDTDLWYWESAVYADGGQILTDDGSAPAFGKDYDYVGAKFPLRLQEGLLAGYVTQYYDAADDDDAASLALAMGEVGMELRSCNSMPKRFQTAVDNGHTLSTWVQPAGEGGIHITGGGSNWMISEDKSDTEKLFAGAYLAYLAKPENVLLITEKTGSMMITDSALNSEEGRQIIADFPGFQATYDSIPYLHARPNTPYWAEMYTYGIDKFEQFALKPAETDVYAMIDDFETKIQQIIDDNAW